MEFETLLKEADALGLPVTEKPFRTFDGRIEYYGAAEPPVRCGESHLSGLTEPPVDSYSA